MAPWRCASLKLSIPLFPLIYHPRPLILPHHPPFSPRSRCEIAVARHASARHHCPSTGPLPLLPHDRLDQRRTSLHSHVLSSIARKSSTRRDLTPCPLQAAILLSPKGPTKVSPSLRALFARYGYLTLTRRSPLLNSALTTQPTPPSATLDLLPSTFSFSRYSLHDTTKG